MFKKFVTLVLSLILALSFGLFGCNNNNKEDDEKQEEKQEEEVQKEKIMDNLVKNFWEETTMYDESIMLVAETDDDGNVISAPKAKLLMTPTNISQVTWYFNENNAGQKVTFTKDVDFYVDGDYIIAYGSIEKNVVSEVNEFLTNMPYVTDKQLTGELPFPNLTSRDIPSKTDGLYLPFTESYQVVQLQLSVTYTHAEGLWTGATPTYQGDVLSNVVTKLKNKEEVDLFIYGDSISTGANSSSVLNIEPYLSTWMQLVTDNLASWYGTKVNLTNKSVGGWTSANGVNGGTGWVNGVQVSPTGLAGQFNSDLKDYVPDIAIIGFGMNDASVELGVNNYCNNIISMINTIRTYSPDCDIILLGTMLANPMAKNQSKNQTEYSSYLTRIAAQYSNVAVLDIAKMHQSLLDSGKIFTEMSSNNVNHPNDFMARIYAMNILTTLIEK